jgi:hypothetical protein
MDIKMKNTQETEHEYMLKKKEIRHKILGYVWCTPYPCFIDTIISAIPELHGNCNWPADIGNVFYSFRLSPIGLECFQTLIRRRQIHLWKDEYSEQCSFENYPYSPNLIASRNRRVPYREPRWQPATVHLNIMGIDQLC